MNKNTQRGHDFQCDNTFWKAQPHWHPKGTSQLEAVLFSNQEMNSNELWYIFLARAHSSVYCLDWHGLRYLTQHYDLRPTKSRLEVIAVSAVHFYPYFPPVHLNRLSSSTSIFWTTISTAPLLRFTGTALMGRTYRKPFHTVLWIALVILSPG